MAKAKDAKKKKQDDGEEEEKKEKRHRKRKPSFAGYVRKVAKSVNVSVSSKAMKILCSFVQDQFTNIASEAATVTRMGRGKTLGSREVATAVKVMLPTELAKHAASEATKAVSKSHTSYEPQRKAAKEKRAKEGKKPKKEKKKKAKKVASRFHPKIQDYCLCVRSDSHTTQISSLSGQESRVKKRGETSFVMLCVISVVCFPHPFSVHSGFAFLFVCVREERHTHA